MNSETVEALHAVTSALKDVQTQRDEWLRGFEQAGSAGGYMSMTVNRREAEQIFAQRITALEAELEALGWRRTIRVEAERRPAEEID